MIDQIEIEQLNTRVVMRGGKLENLGEARLKTVVSVSGVLRW